MSAPYTHIVVGCEWSLHLQIKLKRRGRGYLDASTPEMLPTACEVVALVRVQLVWPTARLAALSPYIGQGIDQLLENHRVVAVGTSHAEHQRDALAVCDDVAFAAEFSPVRGVGPSVRAPRGLGTLAPSRLARLKSSRPALRSSASSSICNWCHTPASFHWRSRRQQVMPLPKPNSSGNSSQGTPVRSTNRMPLSVISSLTRGRPPLAEGTNTGNSGSIFLNSAVLISLFFLRLTHPQTRNSRLGMTGCVSCSK